MPLQATSGAASYDAFGGGVPVVPAYIEEVFSTYLYTGNGGGSATGFFGTQTITNGIDLSTKGGMVWLKARSAAEAPKLFDTSRGINKLIYSSETLAQQTGPNTLTAFNTTGFNLGSDSDGYGTNTNAVTYASWTCRKAPKFFDVVTFTTSSGGGQTINHNLGATPGMMIVKKTSGTGDWFVWHRSIPNNALALNTTQSVSTFNAPEYVFGDGSVVVQPTSTQFTFYASGSTTYVAYLFAHDAGGFGLTGTDNVISCGSFTTDASSVATVNLGYEPQWVMFKCTSTTDNWRIVDNMRGFANAGSSSDARLFPNSSSQEFFSDTANPTATGFVTQGDLQASQTYIYIAIRRGPMKVPTSGTSVFSPNAYTGGTAGTSFNLGFVPDTLLTMRRDTSNFNILQSRLTGLQYMLTHATDAEAAGVAGTPQWDANTGTIKLATATSVTGWNASGFTYVNEVFARAPNFFDEVCYTGTGSNTTQTHNLTVAPELVIIKSRSNAIVWVVGNTAIGFGNYLLLNATDASASGSNVFNSTAPTSTVFSIGSGSGTNQSGATYVAYLFATLAGVSKVGSYTGNGSSQTINCGFTGGARFVLIKKSSGTGDWMVADSARGIVSGNDPYLELNNTNAEVTGEDWLDTDSTGFVVNEVSGSNANTSGATYIFLAIA